MKTQDARVIAQNLIIQSRKEKWSIVRLRDEIAWQIMLSARSLSIKEGITQIERGRGAIVKHNTAKWLIRPDYGQENVYRLWDKDSNYHKDTSPEVMDGNAKLMENAPQLLFALNQAIAYLVSPQSFDKERLEQDWRELKARALGQ